MEDDDFQLHAGWRPSVTRHPDVANTSVLPRSSCRRCDYPIEGDICPECGDNRFGRAELLDRADRIGRIIRRLKIALFLEITGILIMALTSQPPWSLVARGFGITDMRTIMAMSAIIVFIPGILAASATLRISGNQWRISRRNKVLLRISALAFVLLPATHLILPFIYLIDYLRWNFDFHRLLYYTNWSSEIYLVTMFAGITVLLHAIGICSDQDPDGENRPFLRHGWIGSVGLAILYALTMTVEDHGMEFMELTAFEIHTGANFHQLSLETAGSRSIGMVIMVIYMIYLMVFLGGMSTWRTTLTRQARHGNQP